MNLKAAEIKDLINEAVMDKINFVVTELQEKEKDMAE